MRSEEYEKRDTNARCKIAEGGVLNNSSAENGVSAAVSVKNSRSRGQKAASYIAKIGMFSALSFVLYLLKFPLPFIFPVWLELHFSDIAAVIAGFALGPVAGCLVAILRVEQVEPVGRAGLFAPRRRRAACQRDVEHAHVIGMLCAKIRHEFALPIDGRPHRFQGVDSRFDWLTHV